MEAHLKGEAIGLRCRTQHPDGEEAGLLVLEWINDFYTSLAHTDAFDFHAMPMRWQNAQSLISAMYFQFSLHSRGGF